MLAVTGFMGEDELKAHDFSGYLLKPVSVDDLKKLVETALDPGSG